MPKTRGCPYHCDIGTLFSRMFTFVDQHFSVLGRILILAIACRTGVSFFRVLEEESEGKREASKEERQTRATGKGALPIRASLALHARFVLFRRTRKMKTVSLGLF